jgi:hypothetical protein
VLVSKGFDHSKTKFPLHGKHSALECSKCHKTVNFDQPVAHEQGQFVKRADGGDCKACHNETSYRPSLFSKEDHQKTAYPLMGKHAAVECAKCHPPKGERTVYKVRFDNCMRCHEDAHGGQFAGAPHGNNCESCHNVDGFKPSLFTLTKHDATAFALTGAHAATACAECHKSPAGFFPAKPAQYKFPDTSCTVCHRDPHESGTASLRLSCTDCHTTRDWKSVGAFDHGRTKFTLDGAHRAVICTECHKPSAPAALAKGMGRDIVFRGASTLCASCHEDIHGGQFDTAMGKANCASCHVTMKWKATTFDHQKTTFPLDGQHKSVACLLCHKERKEIGGRLVVAYKGAARTCRACHSNLGN